MKNQETIKQLKKVSSALNEARRALLREPNVSNAIHRIALMQSELYQLLSDVMTPAQKAAWESFPKDEMRTVVVTGDQAILKKGSVAMVRNTGHGCWLVIESNGQSVSPATIFLVEGRDF